jgi:Fanconi anemia group M protein
VPDMLRRIPGVIVESVDLLCGDYAVGANGLGIERKEAVDFISSILDGRLVNQAPLLRIEYENPVILVEGDIYSTRSNIAHESLDGMLSWLALKMGITVLMLPDIRRTAAMIHRMSLHTVHGLGYEVPLRTGKPKEIEFSAQFLIEGLPGTGPNTATKLLRHFGTAQAVLIASVSELRAVSCVGPKLAERIREVLECKLKL